MKRLVMWIAEQVLRLRAQGLSGLYRAVSPGISRGTVGNYLRRTYKAGLSWSLAEGMTEKVLEQSLFPPPEPGSPGGQSTPAASALAKQFWTEPMGSPRLCTALRLESPCDRSYRTSRIYRIGNLFMGLPSCYPKWAEG